MKKLIVPLLILLLFGCDSEKETMPDSDYYQITGKAQGTTYSILYQDEKGRNFKTGVDSLLLAFDASLSTYVENSEISSFNRSDSGVAISEVFAEMLLHAWFVYEESEQAFDPTINPLLSFWGFNKEKISQPDSIDPTAIQEALAKKGFDQIGFSYAQAQYPISDLPVSSYQEEGVLVKQEPYLQLNFNAIAQGFSVDLLARYLSEKGISQYMIELGGETLVNGKNATGEPWRIGVDKPKEGKRELNAIIHLEEGALASSGNYRKFYVKNGKKYAHTIDPRTGYPVDHGLLSATVLAPTCWMADGFATACMVNGPDLSKKLAEDNPEIEVYLVYDLEGEITSYTSKGLKEKIELLAD